MTFAAEVVRQDRPLTGHEIGQWTFYPNFNEIAKYSGVLQRKTSSSSALTSRPSICSISRRSSSRPPAATRDPLKEEIEVLLRTPKYAGFSLLDLHDYPGQGTALIGLLDPFWDSKGFVTPAAHSRYCGPTVPLLRMPRRIYTTDEPFVAEADLAHYGPAPLSEIVPTWTIRDDQGRHVAGGTLESRTVPTGELTHLGTLRASLASAHALPPDRDPGTQWNRIRQHLGDLGLPPRRDRAATGGPGRQPRLG